MSKRLAISISGQVQGVFFRNSAAQLANQLGVSGFARNQPDGSVYIEAEGDRLDDFIGWCHHGPEAAQVAKVEINEIKPQNSTTFTID